MCVRVCVPVCLPACVRASVRPSVRPSKSIKKQITSVKFEASVCVKVKKGLDTLFYCGVAIQGGSEYARIGAPNE